MEPKNKYINVSRQEDSKQGPFKIKLNSDGNQRTRRVLCDRARARDEHVMEQACAGDPIPNDEKLIRKIDYEKSFLTENKVLSYLLDLEIIPQILDGVNNKHNKINITIESPLSVQQEICRKQRSNHNQNYKAIKRSRRTLTDYRQKISYSRNKALNKESLLREIQLRSSLKTSSAELGASDARSDSYQSTSESCTLLSPREFFSSISQVAFLRAGRETCFNSKRPIMSNNKKDDSSSSCKTKKPSKIDKATLIITNSSSDDSLSEATALGALNKRIQSLESKVQRQEMEFRRLEHGQHALASTSSEHSLRALAPPPAAPAPAPPAHLTSYIQQYSHVPETTGFTRGSQQPSPCTSTRRTINKEHNSEQYGREFTTYDGITDTRQRRRESASMPLNRVDALELNPPPKGRAKHNTVRDYRLMDTVHYLAQGEFAPRNDGIKLTPSREAVLSDIIWEDVCRSHWPSARLTRRAGPGGSGGNKQFSHRTDLQRQIDNMLRDRITHIERRRRRHYRVMKMNQGNTNAKAVGKTGDVIVASNREPSRYRARADGASSSRAPAECGAPGPRAGGGEVERQQRRARPPESRAGPSAEAAPRRRSQALSPTRPAQPAWTREATRRYVTATVATGPGMSDADARARCVVSRRDKPRRKGPRELQPSNEHYILLPTLVVKTSSYYHRHKKYAHAHRPGHADHPPHEPLAPPPCLPARLPARLPASESPETSGTSTEECSVRRRADKRDVSTYVNLLSTSSLSRSTV